jgi:hypothetical protein
MLFVKDGAQRRNVSPIFYVISLLRIITQPCVMDYRLRILNLFRKVNSNVCEGKRAGKDHTCYE